ncbi:MAG: hypothetical protein J6I35_04905 [Ruminobacter sp.]|uniref:hypothetical protein n=1 Tax=Ruminobacter sp. TaxID=2774296 RepID=UPI001B7C2D8E|nr:hypothetical protein [Ruminobacter sp.]MBP3748875.1 hypothetical protein [Ruminobacter sp.]
MKYKLIKFLALAIAMVLIGRKAYLLYINHTDSGLAYYAKESINEILEEKSSDIRVRELKNLVKIGDENDCQQYFDSKLKSGGKCYESIAVLEKDNSEIPFCIYSERLHRHKASYIYFSPCNRK